MGRHLDRDGDGVADHLTDDEAVGDYVVCDDRPRDDEGALLADAPARRAPGGGHSWEAPR